MVSAVMSWSARLIRSGTRIIVLMAMALAGMWLVFSRPMIAEHKKLKIPPMIGAPELKEYVQTLCFDFAPRDFQHPDNLFRAADYIREQFERSGAKVEEQAYEAQENQYKNVIAQYGPDSPSVIIIGAHYDTIVGTPGADDNASGVAGLLALADLFSNISFTSRVILAAYVLEEPPFFTTDLMGSVVHARALKAQKVDVKLMICFEMIGHFSDEPASQQFPVPFFKFYYPTTGSFIGIVDRLFSRQAGRMKRWMRSATGLPVYSINGPRWLPGIDWSDHMNFWDCGYPAVMITDTAFYRNQSYHLPHDTPDTLDYERMAQVIQGVYGYVLHLAGGKEKN